MPSVRAGRELAPGGCAGETGSSAAKNWALTYALDWGK
jgi:hypothetical protein